ncbi:DUF2516 family protein [Rhodococcus fascians]|uniref:DUF2516 family protein n=1 Tax=Nocardiaceae TaxID=85025 RepID=UPI00050C4BD8|nr:MULTISPECIES: DUF2516 family protein [Rhodococcus]KQU37316.1 hypothetical protein ASH04_03220 [Rhodococcus sp. Leaf233]MBJ7325308.1 DUF2516 family protein [Rhodococcus sp. (in: high G+C Gram-positive bacteria)]MBY4037602.1 DUF2516 family protein [Rhodococcus fascians]MBY4136982.1 DUF2516 family protein [Rhodococcus fascians]MBY4217229.1 DUF2516 family protein [Rhodococcus fascians]
MSIAGSFSFYILTFLQLLGVAGAAYAIFHALRQRSDAFPAVDKLTKNAWLAILFVGLLLILVSGVIGFLGIIGVVAVCVYLVDVRPKLDGIQRGPRW